ncbi:MAG: tetratricopeptide repeat protein, partial [Planctomycetes bacterium]|nr:tetratricopeptide repeat protein [Planctomycetota bacterium]
TPDNRPALALKLSRAEVLKEAGWLQQAIELLEAAREEIKGSLVLGEALALCYKAAGRREREMAVREEVAEARPDSPLASSKLVWALIEYGEWTRAEEQCRAFLKRFHDDLESRVAGAMLAIRRGDYALATADCQTVAGKHAPDERPYALILDAIVRSGQFDRGTLVIRGREGTVPTFVPGPLERAVLAAAEGKWNEALVQAQRGLRLAPRDHRLWMLAGTALERKGDVAEAVKRYQAAAWLQPGQPSLQEMLARIASRAGASTVAAEAYRAAIAHGAGLDVQMEFADALLQWGREDEAISALEAVRPASAAQREAVAIRLAEARLAKGEADAALALVEGILAKDPGAPNAKRVALMAHRAKGDLAAALKLCEAAPPGPDAATADAELGLLHLLAQRYKEASEKLEGAVARTPEGPARADLQRRRAIAFLGQNAPEKALAVLKEASPEPGKRAAVTDALVVLLAAVSRGNAAEELLAQTAKSDPVRSGWLRGALPALAKDRGLAATVLAAYEASSSGWHGKAGELFAKAARVAPDAPLWLQEAAEAHASAGQLEAALAHAQQLVAACPSTGEAYLVLASILDKQGKADAAFADYARGAAMLGKQAAGRRRAAADRLRAGGRLDAAIEAYRAVLDATPDDLAAARALAWLYATHKPDQLAEAERLATRAVEGDPSAAARDTLGWIRFLAKKPDAARPDILAAVTLEPRNPLYYYHLGMVEFVRGRKDRARRALRIALALDPKLPDAETARSTLKAIEAESPAPATRP